MTPKRNILFLCTGNSCRSQMAEAILRHIGGDRFEAHSAGSHPAGFIHPLAMEAMRRLDVPVLEQTSKGWGTFTDLEADAVITLCDDAAREPCPTWSGRAVTAHWSLPDPAYHPGTEEERIEFAVRVAQRLRAKIEGLVEIDFSQDAGPIGERLRFLGEI